MNSILAVLIVLFGSNVERLDAISCYSCQFPSWHYSAALCTEPFHGESEPTCTASTCIIRFANNTDHQENYHVLRNCTDYENIQEDGCRRFERMYGSMFYKDDNICCFKGNLSHKAQKPVPTTTCLCQSDRCNEHMQLLPNVVTTSSGLPSTTKYYTTTSTYTINSTGITSTTRYPTPKSEGLPSPTRYDTSTSRKLTSSTEHITSSSETMTSPTEYDISTSEDIASPTEYDITLSEDMTSPIEYDTTSSEDMMSITEDDTPLSEDMTLSTEYDTPTSEDLPTNTKDAVSGTTFPDTPHTCDDPSASSPVKRISKLAVVVVTIITIILSIS